MLEAGASGYVLKRAAYGELRSAVRAATRGQSYLSPDVTGLVIEAHTRPASGTETPGHASLGAREREIVQLLAEGHTSREIAQQLHISTTTVETHRRNIMKKLGVHNIAELTKYAIREGMTSLDN
jgi:two-component system NarL family response regulator